MAETRTETDSFGPLEVPADKYWGAQTQRAVDNFPISGLTMPRQFIAALGLVNGLLGMGNQGFDRKFEEKKIDRINVFLIKRQKRVLRPRF